MVIRNLLVVVAVTLVISACSDRPPTGGGVGSSGYFPNMVGMLWKYEVYDSLTHTRDTVWASVTDRIASTADSYSNLWKWHRIGSGEVEVLTVQKFEDTILFIDTRPTDPIVVERFELPLNLGKQWIGPGFGDTSVVTNYGDYTVPAGTFTQVSRVDRVWNQDFEGGSNHSTTWIALTRGILYRHLFESYSDGATVHVTVNETWKLIDYDLRTFRLEEFPNQVGNEWVYQLVDTTLGLIDTVTVTIVDRFDMQYVDSVTMWVAEGREYHDTVYWTTMGNRLTVSSDTLQYDFDDKYYVFPLAVGREWGIIFANPVVPVPTVFDIRPYSTPAGDFRSAFGYFAGGGGFNVYWTVTEWLVPGVGVVWREHTRFGFGPVFTQEWTLLDYSLTYPPTGPI